MGVFVAERGIDCYMYSVVSCWMEKKKSPLCCHFLGYLGRNQHMIMIMEESSIHVPFTDIIHTGKPMGSVGLFQDRKDAPYTVGCHYTTKVENKCNSSAEKVQIKCRKSADKVQIKCRKSAN